MVAVNQNQIESVKALLSYKASVRIKNSDGETAMTIAKKNNFTEIIDLLK